MLLVLRKRPVSVEQVDAALERRRWVMTPNVNVLLAAARSDHPHHAVARAWLKHAATGAAAGSA